MTTEIDIDKFAEFRRGVGSAPEDFRDKNLATAVYMALEIHRDHKRKDGTSHVTHLANVASMLQKETKETQALAWLHDSLEMTELSEEDLRHIGFSIDFIEDLRALTHVDKEPYNDYIDRVNNSIARVKAVKVADIIDNLTDQPNEDRKQKYRDALIKLLFGKRKYS